MICSICERIGDAISQIGNEFEEVAITTSSELHTSAQSCPTCHTVLTRGLRENSSDLEPEIRIYLLNFGAPDSDLQIADEGQDSLYLEVAPLSSKGRYSTGIRVDKEWIDIERVKRWLRFCDCRHGQSCIGFPAQKSIGPAEKLLLIDVVEGCLIEAPGTTRYFALSYVWGKSSGETALETNVGNVLAHKTKGALGAHRNDLPETIRDSMRLVESLGERYLWVDRLCIIQDDFEQKGQQIAQMGAIYAYSYCTIIAASGDGSNYGLRGVGNGSRPRSFQQTMLDFPRMPCVLLGSPWAAEQASLWNTRGWTFQEKMMSRRSLIFADDSIMWRCQQSIWREDLTDDTEDCHSVRPAPRSTSTDVFNPSPWPNLLQWKFLVQLYNRRDLSFESDRLAAIAGVESALNHSFPGIFIYGLPSFFFDVALLWQPAVPMKRRSDPSGKQALPSWSWVGWHGTMDPKTAYFGFDYFHHSTSEDLTSLTTCIVIPLVTWYYQDHAGGGKHKIDNGYAEWRSIATSNMKLPDGWSEQPGQDGRTVFSHLSLPGVVFNWPIPLGRTATSLTSGRPAPYITCRTSKAELFIGERIRRLDFVDCSTVTLRNSEGQWVGVLRINQSMSDTVSVGEACELIAISRGQANNAAAHEADFFEEWQDPERPKDGALYEFYNVLWVEHSGKHLVRKALGRVVKAAWEKQRSPECEISLQ